jgi:ribosome-binding protein aMBF1 (putative translation factor)
MSENVLSGGDVQSVTLAGERFVLVPEREYRRLQQAVQAGEPLLPPPDAQGNYPAVATLRAMLARDIVRQRRALGLTQAELARRAGIRVETLNRLEQGKHSPSTATVDKIDRALKAAEAQQAARRKPSRTRSGAKRKPRAPARKTCNGQ